MVNKFVNGLISHIRIAMRLHTPMTIGTALCLAAHHEEELELLKRKPSYKSKYHKPFVKQNNITGSLLGTIPLAASEKKGTGKLEETFESLREMRRAKGLCLKCGDKYALGHKCATQISNVRCLKARNKK